MLLHALNGHAILPPQRWDERLRDGPRGRLRGRLTEGQMTKYNWMGSNLTGTAQLYFTRNVISLYEKTGFVMMPKSLANMFYQIC